MKINLLTERELENYSYDSKIGFGVYFTLDKNKIESNEKQFKEHGFKLAENSYSIYSIKYSSFDNYTILTILEDGKKVHSQFLITTKEAFECLDIKYLTNYVDSIVAELVIDFFE